MDNQDPYSDFNTNPDTQGGTNPFTGDLKGEFSSDFGTNTNAVSQIFKNSSFGGDNRKKFIAIGAAAVLLLGVVAFILTDPDADSFEADFAEEMDTPAKPKDVEGLSDDDFEDDDAFGDDSDFGGDDFVDEGRDLTDLVDQIQPSASVGGFSLKSPVEGAERSYDETSAPAEFTWDGAADRINFSRHRSMQPLYKSVGLSGASFYALEQLHAGTWYWQVVNSEGASEVRSFRVSNPVRRSFPVAQPQDGGSISGQGGVVSWAAGDKVARYSVEMVSSGQDFMQPMYRFGTSGTSIALQGVQAGSYDIRVGAFSEVSGRWEWQYIRNVSVQ